MTDWKERDVEVDLSFLGDGEFNAEIFRDGINADRVGKDYKREVIRVSANKKLNLHMAPGDMAYVSAIYSFANIPPWQ